MIANTPSTGTMTYDEFLAWAEEGSHVEWVNGEVVPMSPASDLHQLLLQFFVRVLSSYVEFYNLGLVLCAPFQMKLVRSGREPDLMFIANEHRDRLKRNHLVGPADLVVEIILPESLERDRTTKFGEYEQAGVLEYWLFDPLAEQAYLYRLNAQGRYAGVLPDANGCYHSTVIPGFWLNGTWLWQTPLPGVDDVLFQIGGDAYAQRLIERLRQRRYLAG